MRRFAAIQLVIGGLNLLSACSGSRPVEVMKDPGDLRQVQESFARDPSAARRKYLGQRLTFEGPVVVVDQVVGKPTRVGLLGEYRDRIGGAMCVLRPGQEQLVSGLKAMHSRVLFSGRVVGMQSTNVLLDDCLLAQSEEPLRLPVSAAAQR